jgi:hypothetical protein
VDEDQLSALSIRVVAPPAPDAEPSPPARRPSEPG